MKKFGIDRRILEAIMLGVVAAAFLRLAIPNFIEIRERVADATAQREFHIVKNALRRISTEKGRNNMALMLHQGSEASLPPPLSEVQLEPGVRVNYAVRMKFTGYFDLMALEVVHESGKHSFRLLEINNKGMEQIIRNRA